MLSSRLRRARRHGAALFAASLFVILVALLVAPLSAAAGIPATSAGEASRQLALAPVRLAGALVAAMTQPPAKRPLPRARQEHRHAGGTFHLYPPLPHTVAEGRAPVVMMLHGMCSQPLPTCDYWSRAGREGSFLVCPSGNGRCGSRPDWAGNGERKAQFLDSVLDAVGERYGEHLAAGGDDILIGFSRGAFVARDVAYARPGRYRGIIFIGAALSPDPQRLRESGIERVVFAAGEHDGARPTMQRAAARLTAAGLPSRYISTGKIWHQLPHDLERIMRDAIGWIREGGERS